MKQQLSVNSEPKRATYAQGASPLQDLSHVPRRHSLRVQQRLTIRRTVQTVRIWARSEDERSGGESVSL
jgi:hypothetical protein